MKKKKVIIPGNYLDRIPACAKSIKWNTETDGVITLEIENTGWANCIAQVLFFRPKVSYVHLDKLGSFVWPLIDGEKSIAELGKLVDEAFGEEAYPLYERLSQYFRVLDNYHFVHWIK